MFSSKSGKHLTSMEFSESTHYLKVEQFTLKYKAIYQLGNNFQTSS